MSIGSDAWLWSEPHPTIGNSATTPAVGNHTSALVDGENCSRASFGITREHHVVSTLHVHDTAFRFDPKLLMYGMTTSSRLCSSTAYMSPQVLVDKRRELTSCSGGGLTLLARVHVLGSSLSAFRQPPVPQSSVYTGSSKGCLFSCCLPSDQIGIYLASLSLNMQQVSLRQAEYAYAISALKFAGLDSIIRQAQAVYVAQWPCVWRKLCSIKSL